jgi:hypothetical protein
MVSAPRRRRPDDLAGANQMVSVAQIFCELFVVAALVWFLLAQGSGILQGFAN